MYKHGGDIYNHEHVIDFSANINFKGMPWAVKEAAMAAVTDCIHYPDVECSKLRQAIGGLIQLPAEHIVCGNGAADLIFSLVLAVKPKKALVMAPGFYEYEQALKSVGCDIAYYRLEKEAEFLPGEDLPGCITEEVDLVFLCNPNNPTGALISKKMLMQILNKCEHTDTLFVLDECFMDFLLEPETDSMLEQVEHSDNLFVLKAFTKMYGMAGLRLGYGCTKNRWLLEQLTKVRQPWSVSIPAQQAGIAAVKEQEFVKQSRIEIEEQKQYLLAAFENLDLTVYGSSANYIFFWDNQKENSDLFELCLENGFLIRDCSNYEGLEKGYYRIAVRSRKENEQLVTMLGKVRTCQK